MNISSFLKAKAFIQAETKLQLELTQLDTILRVYRAGDAGLSVTDIAKATGVSNSAAGRTAATMSLHGYRNTKMSGWGLAEAYTDYANPRFKMIRITARGITVVEKFLELLKE